MIYNLPILAQLLHGHFWVGFQYCHVTIVGHSLTPKFVPTAWLTLLM